MPLDDALHAELVLNALVALRFLTPQMPKSWHFQTQHTQHTQHTTDAWQPLEGDSVLVCVNDGGIRPGQAGKSVSGHRPLARWLFQMDIAAR